MSPENLETLEQALDVIEDLIGVLQELHHKFQVTEDLSDYGVAERFMDFLEAALDRYDSLD